MTQSSSELLSLHFSHGSVGFSTLLPSRSNPSISSCRDRNDSLLVVFYMNTNSCKGVYIIIISDYNKYIVLMYNLF